MKIRFTKMSGAGNDFVLIDNRSGVITDGPTLAKKLCDRRWGVGADGLLMLEPSKKAHYKMMYYNADGSYGGMCGNGGRCVAEYAYRNGIAPERHSFEALDFVYNTVRSDASVTLLMKDPKDIKLNIPVLIGKKKAKVHFVNTGSPHVVIPVQNLTSKQNALQTIDVTKIGRLVRFHKKFSPEGANVNFVQVGEDNRLEIRTYERGVESETLACGTGSIAGAIIAHQIWKVGPPIQITPASKVRLTVNFNATAGRYTSVSLSGPAQVIFEGSVDV